MKLKIGDVYNFNWNQSEYDKQAWGGALSHCFEGLLVVMEVHRYNQNTKKYAKEIMLVDTFWGINREADNKRFTLEEAQQKGSLEFYCNLNDIEKVERYYLDEYEDEDLFRLHYQHSCVEGCVYWYKNKKAKKSPRKKIEVLKRKIAVEKSSIDSSVRNIESMSSEIKKLEIEGFKE